MKSVGRIMLDLRGAHVVLFLCLSGLWQIVEAAPTEVYLEYSQQQFVEIPHQDSLDLSVPGFTVSSWIRPFSWGQNNQGRILDHGGGSSGDRGWSLHIQDSGSVARTLSFQINNDASYNHDSNVGVIQLNTWQYVAVTYESGTLTFYVNGTEQGVRTGVPVPLSRLSSLRVGMRATDLQRGFDGDIDELQIWGRALSSAEILVNMNTVLTGGEVGLIAYYPLDSAQGQVAFDQGPLLNDAVLGSTSSSDVNDPVWWSVAAEPATGGWPTNGWSVVLPASVGLEKGLLEQARDYALSGGGSGAIIKDGLQVLSWGSQTTRYDLKSSTKSFGAALTGLALDDGLISLDHLAQFYLPGVGVPPQSNSGTGWLEQITLKHLLTHTAGFDKSGGFISIQSQPGTLWSYSDGGANWLADVLTVTFDLDLNTVLFNRLLTPMGLSAADVVWRNNAYRTDTIEGIKRREFGSGISANVDAMARFGYLFLRKGEWDDQQLLSENYIAELNTAVPALAGLDVNLPGQYFSAAEHYGYLWWNNADGVMQNVPVDTYWSWGLGESLIVVIPSLNIVAARAGAGWRTGWDGDYSVIEPFIEAIVLSTLGENFAVTVNSGTNILDVLANDLIIGFSNETLAIINVGATSTGGVVNNLSTYLEYTPAADFTGTETLDYTVQSSSGTTFTVTVTLDVQVSVADGDLTGDGVVDVRDILRGYKIILGQVMPDAAEIQRGDVAPLVNGQPASDGVLNLGDILLIQRKVLGNLSF